MYNFIDMTKKQSRFSVQGTSNIEEKYVMYVEDLHVSFYGNAVEKQIKEKISIKESLIKSLDKKLFKDKINNLKQDIKELSDILNDVAFKKQVSELRKEASKLKKDSSKKEEYKKLSSRIKEIESNMIQNLKGEKKVLKGITLGVRQGETLALVGANGAGKTVLLETVLGFNIPKSYKKIVLNLGNKKFAKNLQEVGIQYQQSKMPSTLRVKQVILKYKKIYGKRVDKAVLVEMIEQFGVFDFLNAKIESLSGGQKQRLNLLLAIMHQPKLMILDEFITGLDVKSVRKIITYVNELKLKNNASMIIVSHQPEEIEELADRIVVMKDGVVAQQTNVQEVTKKHGDMHTFVEGVI